MISASRSVHVPDSHKGRRKPWRKKSSWLVQCFPESHVQVKVQPVVLGNVITNTREKHQVIKPLDFGRVHIGTKHSGSLKQTQPTNSLAQSYLVFPPN